MNNLLKKSFSNVLFNNILSIILKNKIYVDKINKLFNFK